MAEHISYLELGEVLVTLHSRSDLLGAGNHAGACGGRRRGSGRVVSHLTRQEIGRDKGESRGGG